MKRILLLMLFVAGSLQAQMTINDKPLNDEQKKMMKETFSKEKLLTKSVDKSCKCVDSISTQNSSAVENAAKIRTCIDKQVVDYQTALKVFETIDQKEGEKLTLTIYTNPKSDVYIKHYREIERQLMDSCKVVKDVVGRNDAEKETSVSSNSLAIKEYNKGNDYLRKEDYKNALPYYEKAVKIDSNFGFAWDNIGVCNRRLGNYDAALKAYEKSLQLDPKSPTALQNFPLVYVAMGDYKKAIKAYSDFEAIDNTNPEVYYGIAVVYLENLKDYEKSLDYMCRAYNMYVKQGSPYRSDAEKTVQRLYKLLKADGKENAFNEILKKNNLNSN